MLLPAKAFISVFTDLQYFLIKSICTFPPKYIPKDVFTFQDVQGDELLAN